MFLSPAGVCREEGVRETGSDDLPRPDRVASAMGWVVWQEGGGSVVDNILSNYC